jgi:hypothetical protein
VGKPVAKYYESAAIAGKKTGDRAKSNTAIMPETVSTRTFILLSPI